VLEHIEDDVRAVMEIERVLRPGGAFIFSVPAHPWLYGPHDEALHHRRRYRERALRQLMERPKLRLSRLSYWNTTLFPLFCARRLAAQWQPAQTSRSDTELPSHLTNELLAGLLAIEAALVRRIRLPWGLSLIGFALRT
jgi:SAM-dependent methyltransferase